MLWALIVILVVLWLLGFIVVPVGSGLIHLLLLIALVILIYQLVTGRRTLSGPPSRAAPPVRRHAAPVGAGCPPRRRGPAPSPRRPPR